jgi:outer membrane protein insertion porin family
LSQAAVPGIRAESSVPSPPSPEKVDARPDSGGAAPELKGRTVEGVRIVGNERTPASVILQVVRTHEGSEFDPATVEADYQRIYSLKKFSNVEAKVEPTRTGVIVVFQVSEQRLIRSIAFKGNQHVDTSDLQGAIDLTEGQAIDPFRISLARLAIENYYHDKNYSFAHVKVDQTALREDGQLVFQIVEGPQVRIRNVSYRGNATFPAGRLNDQIASKPWIWIFRAGTYRPTQVDDDVAAIREYYNQHGFFDARVGRKLIWSPDMSELEIRFLIDEGARYRVKKVLFRGNQRLSDKQLREKLKLTEGQFYDAEGLQRDVRELVRAYSPFGYIYDPHSQNPDYLHIDDRTVFLKDPAEVELVYSIHEGKPFRIGRILVKGNSKTKEKVVLRELRVAPGQMYNAGELSDAMQRLRSGPYFTAATVTPIGNDPESRDLLVEVNERRTASITIGAGVNSNGGVAGAITYQQTNFDIANWPTSFRDLFSDRSFTGAGQYFRASFEPGTQGSNATVAFGEPWLFDRPYSFNSQVYLRDREREHYDERRMGGQVGLGKRFDYVWSALLTLRGEDVVIHDISDPAIRAPEILKYKGHSTVTSAGVQLRRDTTNSGFYYYKGTNSSVGWDLYGALGGDFAFNKFSAEWNGYLTLNDDMLDRKTVLGLHANGGYIPDDAPFFERFYGGGIGSVRGFAFRGISPRSGLDHDPIGGDFSTTATAELSFPLAGDNLRGVAFVDAGDVEPDFHFGTIRSSAGFGIRLFLPFFGQAPLALDFAVPLNKASQDDTQIISFSFGLWQ